MDLSDDDTIVLLALKESEKASVHEIAMRTGLSTTRVESILQRLISKGLIKQSDISRASEDSDVQNSKNM